MGTTSELESRNGLEMDRQVNSVNLTFLILWHLPQSQMKVYLLFPPNLIILIVPINYLLFHLKHSVYF